MPSFPETSWLVILDARDRASPTWRSSMERLVALYREPIQAYLRRRWCTRPGDAEDLSQDFFRLLLARDVLAKVAPERGRFRTYVVAVTDNLWRMAARHERCRRRGGGVPHVSLVEEAHCAVDRETPERALLRDWARHLVDSVLADMRVHYAVRGRLNVFDVFRLHDVERPPDVDLSHRALAARFTMSRAEVNNALHRCRAFMRRLVLQRVRDTVDSEDQVLSELRALFGRA